VAPPTHSSVKAPVGGEYSATLAAVVSNTSIPYRYLQLDSWRYFKVKTANTKLALEIPEASIV
jgi:hypothetical protein